VKRTIGVHFNQFDKPLQPRAQRLAQAESKEVAGKQLTLLTLGTATIVGIMIAPTMTADTNQP
jgi:hypothetical protein